MSDASLIDALGGPAKVAELLGYDKHGGVQRVHNWRHRGIPARVKLAHPALFLARPEGAPTEEAVAGPPPQAEPTALAEPILWPVIPVVVHPTPQEIRDAEFRSRCR